MQRDRPDRAQVVRDVLADLAVAARRSPLERAVAVDEADRQPVDLGLDDEAEAGVGDPLAREMVAHAIDPRAQLLLRAHVAEREHRLEVPDLLQAANRLAAHSLGRGVGRGELGVAALELAQLVEQPVVLVVADLGVVEGVVAVGVVFERLTQLARAVARRARRLSRSLAHGLASRAGRSPIGGASSPSRSKRLSASRLGRSVRSKWMGVTAIRPAATAARSVPGSSRNPGSEP